MVYGNHDKAVPMTKVKWSSLALLPLIPHIHPVKGSTLCQLSDKLGRHKIGGSPIIKQTLFWVRGSLMKITQTHSQQTCNILQTMVHKLGYNTPLHGAYTFHKNKNKLTTFVSIMWFHSITYTIIYYCSNVSSFFLKRKPSLDWPAAAQ